MHRSLKMKHVIVQSVKDANRCIRRINKNGEMLKDVKCSTLIETAKDIIMQKLALEGQLKAPDILDSVSASILMEKILEEKSKEKGDFFVPRESINYETGVRIWNILLQIRMGEVTEEYKNSLESKLIQIQDVIASYEKKLIEQKKYDLCRIYQEAIYVLEEKAGQLFTSVNKYAISDVCLERLTAVEKRFWEKLTGGVYEIKSFQTITGKSLEECCEEEHKKILLQGAKFFKGYGISNEVNYVAENIKKQKQNYGEVCVLYTSPEYEPFLEAQFGSSKIPYCMTSRQLATDNRYVGLMKLVLRWAESGYLYSELKSVVCAQGAYKVMMPFYDEIRKNIGWGLERYKAYVDRMSLKDDEKADYETCSDEEKKEKYKEYEKKKEYIEFLRKLIYVFDFKDMNKVSYKEVYSRLLGFVRDIIGTHEDYVVVKNALYQEIKIFEQMGTACMDDVIYMLQKRVNALHWSDLEENNAVVIERLTDKVRILDRKYIYLIGMSAAHFGQKAVSSPILSDEELGVYLNKNAGFVRFANQKERRLSENLYRTLTTGGNEKILAIGYCGYDTINLRKQTPSVTFLRMLQNVGKTKKEVEAAGYTYLLNGPINFASKDVWRVNAIEQVIEKDEVRDEETKFKKEKINIDKIQKEELEKPKPIKISVTGLQTLLECPLKYYYQRVCWLAQEDYKMPDSDKWLSAAEKGILAHAILENYIKKWFVGKRKEEFASGLEEDSFQKICEQAVSDMVKECPYTSETIKNFEQSAIIDKCKRYLEMMHQEFTDSNNEWMVAGCEVEYKDFCLYFNENGRCKKEEAKIELCFEGFIDRLDYRIDKQGIKHYRIIDYKSGRKKNLDKKIESGTLVQHIIYAMAMEEKAIEKNKSTVVVDEVDYCHLFEEDITNQLLVCPGNEELSKKAELLIADTLINSEFNRLEKMKINAAQKVEILSKTDCSYCAYKDVCKEYMGEEV